MNNIDWSKLITAEQKAEEAEKRLIDEYTRAIESHVDAVARERDYKDAVSLASYFNSTVEPWSSEAKAFVPWRDRVWKYAFAELKKVNSGARERPSVEAFVAELPDIDWPDV